jgi:hypothetical protein
MNKLAGDVGVHIQRELKRDDLDEHLNSEDNEVESEDLQLGWRVSCESIENYNVS